SQFLPSGEGTPIKSNMRLYGPNGEEARLVDNGQGGFNLQDGQEVLQSFATAQDARRKLSDQKWITPDGTPIVHEEPMRRGWFLGDGTGAGKGRQLVGILNDNLNQGRKKHVWVSEKNKLYNDAERDLDALGVDKAKLFS